MAQNERRTWIIAYDIADPRRLNRVHRFISQQAAPVQYSIYTLEAAPRAIERLCAELQAYIHPRADDVRIYPLPRWARIMHIGRRPLPEGLALYDAGLPLLQRRG
ncbi:MAG: CRISPR-associated endonuclease Cas2 [Burkholderiales bacterium]|nr:CRISPR-associated endonuclease Cas2 [Burkholderiales bacterium]